MNIRILNKSDAWLYQKIRLDSLEMNPEAFASTYQQEINIPLNIIAERLQSSTKDRFILGSFDDEGV